jgi:hypothetical protein
LLATAIDYNCHQQLHHDHPLQSTKNGMAGVLVERTSQ